MLRPPRTQMSRVQSQRALIWRSSDKKMEVWGRDHVWSHCTANLTSDFDHQFWPKTGHFEKEVRSVAHVTAPTTQMSHLQSQRTLIWRFNDKIKGGLSQGPRSVALHCKFDQLFWSSILTQNRAFRQKSEVGNACYGPRQRKCHVYSPKGQLCEAPMKRKMEVWGRDHV